MKKVLPVLVLGSLLAALLLPMASLAQEEIPKGCVMKYTITDCPAVGIICNVPPDGTCAGICCLLNTIYSVTNWFFYILIILSTILIIWGAFGILFAAGNPEGMKKGRSAIIYALVGIALALFAKIIPSVVRYIMGV